MPQISVFTNVRTDKTPKAIELNTVLNTVISGATKPDLRALLERIKHTPDKAERSHLKAKLPGFTPSALCEGGHAKSNFVQHSGYISFDIDGLTKESAPILRNELFNIPFVYFAALSASGQGVWGLVPVRVNDPKEHIIYFEALASDFASINIKLDSACKDLTRFRFYSHDPQARINPDAIPYKRILRPKPQKKSTYKANQFKTSGNVFEQGIRYCKSRGYTFTQGRDMHNSIVALCSYYIKKAIPKSDAEAWIRQNICNDIQTNCISDTYQRWEKDFGQWSN